MGLFFTISKMFYMIYVGDGMCKSKKKVKVLESIQSSTTPDPGYQWESNKVSKGAKIRNRYNQV